MGEAEEEIGTWFLIPLRRSSDDQLHVVELWRCLREEVYAIAGGWTGPESVKVLRKDDPVPGGWRSPTGAREEDESRKYTVIIPRSHVEALREVLLRAANSFDQKEILFMVQEVKQSVRLDPSQGFLKGDPAGG